MAQLDPDVAGWVRGVVGSAVAGAATRVALPAAARQFAKASTGAPLSTLHGAARERATRAFFGGGSLVSGGGGMKLGGITLNVAAAGSSLLITGLMVKNRGTRARTEADTHRAEVDVAIAELEQSDQLLRGVRKRARELDDILVRLACHATETLDWLESETFNIDLHGERLQAALILVTSVRAVATAPIADENCNLDENTEQLILKYREVHEEADDV